MCTVGVSGLWAGLWCCCLLPFHRWIHPGSFFKGCKQKGLIPAILVVLWKPCCSPGHVSDLWNSCSPGLRTCWDLLPALHIREEIRLWGACPSENQGEGRAEEWISLLGGEGTVRASTWPSLCVFPDLMGVFICDSALISNFLDHQLISQAEFRIWNTPWKNQWRLILNCMQRC